MHVTKTKFARAVSALAILGLAACSGSGTNPASTTQENLSANVLQFSVGTANIAGVTGLNVVATYRQPAGALHAGDSAVAVDSPTLTTAGALPATAGSPDGFYSTIETGPAPIELGTHSMTSTGQNQSTPSTFGRSGGVFSLGIEPFNYGEGGQPDSITPYVQPLYGPSGSSSGLNAFIPWGGPPAFDPNHDGEGTRDGKIYPNGTLGIEEGLDVFSSITPVAGPYTLSVAIPANTGTVSFTKTAGLASTTPLPDVVGPTPVLDGSGGLTFTATLPPGVTEAYVQVVDIGLVASSGSGAGTSCNGSSPGVPTYYTVVVRPGSLSGTIGDASGPLGTPSICTSAQNTTQNSGNTTLGDAFTVQLIGFDYPVYEASPTISQSPNPAIVGSAGQSDVTISSQVGYQQAASGIVSRLSRGQWRSPAQLLHRR